MNLPLEIPLNLQLPSLLLYCVPIESYDFMQTPALQVSKKTMLVAYVIHDRDIYSIFGMSSNNKHPTNFCKKEYKTQVSSTQ